MTSVTVVVPAYNEGATFAGSLAALADYFAMHRGGDYEFHNVSGDIQLTFGASPSAHFDVSSFSGDIENSFGPRPTRVSKYSPGMELHFTSGGGDAQVSARTLSGDIRIND